MISSNVDQILKELQDYHKDTVRRLENMVQGFAYTIAKTAISNTPLGNAAPEDPGGYFELYKLRQNRIGLKAEEGFARGSWQVNTDGQFSVQQIYGATSGSETLALIKTNLESYKLGQTLYIGNKGFYIRQLENNYSDQTNELGIMQPTLDSIMQTHRVDLQRLFNEG